MCEVKLYSRLASGWTLSIGTIQTVHRRPFAMDESRSRISGTRPSSKTNPGQNGEKSGFCQEGCSNFSEIRPGIPL
jgi:hypothetical protein